MSHTERGGGHFNFISDSSMGDLLKKDLEAAAQTNLGEVSICDTEQDVEGEHGTGGYR